MNAALISVMITRAFGETDFLHRSPQSTFRCTITSTSTDTLAYA